MKEGRAPHLALVGLAVGGATIVLLNELARDVAMDRVGNPHVLSLRAF